MSTLIHSQRSVAQRLEAWAPGLLILSSAYLMLPYGVFFFGWLRWPLAIAATAVLAAPCWEVVRTARGLAHAHEREQPAAPVFWHQFFLLILAALVLSFLSGAGGYGAQDSDHPKHNAIFKALVEEPWPAAVETSEGSYPLVYYIAYYLPAAAVGKLAGWEAAHHFLQFWTALGLVLSLWWFCVLCRRVSWVAVAVFVFFSGLDIVGVSLIKFIHFAAGRHWDLGGLAWSDVDWASLRWWNWQIRWWDPALLRNYPCNVDLLFFVPQQALAGWILSGIVLHLLLRSGGAARKTLGFYWSLSCLFSPFVTVGLAPLVLFDFVRRGGEGDERGRQGRPGEANRRVSAAPRWWQAGASFLRESARRARGYLSLSNACGLGIFAVMVLYYLARFSHLPFEGDAAAGFRLGHPTMGLGLFLAHMLLFLLLEVGILAWLVWNTGSLADAESRRLFAVAIVFLVVLPFFWYGAINDLVMRASIPALFVLAVFVARALLDREAPRSKKAVLVAVLVLAATNPVVEIYRHVRAIERQGRLVAIPRASEVQSLWTINCRARQAATRQEPVLLRPFVGDAFILQYIGSYDSVFFRWLAPAPAARCRPTHHAAAMRGCPEEISLPLGESWGKGFWASYGVPRSFTLTLSQRERERVFRFQRERGCALYSGRERGRALRLSAEML